MSTSETSSSDLKTSDEISQRKAALQLILAEQRPNPAWRLFNVATLAVAIFGASMSHLPMVAKVALVIAAYLGPVAAFEVWWLRRRFEAALELLGLSQHGL